MNFKNPFNSLEKEKTMLKPTLALAGLALCATPALASSDDAWESFRTDVETACLGAIEGQMDKPRIVVDPFGTEHYGIAVITGASKDADGQVSRICVYDKAGKTVEVNQGFEADALTVTIPEGE